METPPPPPLWGRAEAGDNVTPSLTLSLPGGGRPLASLPFSILRLTHLILLIVVCLLVACHTALPTVPAATPTGPATPTTSPPATRLSSLPPGSATTPPASPPPAEGSEGGGAPVLIPIPWDDRSPFRQGLIETEQAVLEDLPGASVYHLDMRIAGDLKRVQGRQEVRYTNQEGGPLNEVYFHLFPNRLGGRMTIANLKVNGRAVQPGYVLDMTAMRVPLPVALQPGQQVVIQMDFSVEVPTDPQANYGVLAFKDRVLALAHFYPMIAVYDDEGWHVEQSPEYGDLVYADSSFYLVRVTAPAGQTLVASGVEIDCSTGDGTQVVTYAAGPMRDFYLVAVASDQVHVFSQTVGQTTIHSYAILPDGATRALEHAANALRLYGERIGPYPFTELDLVSTPNLALGIEYPGVIALTTRIYGRSARINGTPAPVILEATVAHEVAHQWFYSVVGNDQVNEPWLDEALAQYMTLLYYHDLYGAAAAESFKQSFYARWERVDREAIPIGLAVASYSDREYGAIVYGRGPLFFDALAQGPLGGEKFNAFLQAYYRAYQWGNATSAGLKGVAERVCGCDLTPLFSEWVYAP